MSNGARSPSDDAWRGVLSGDVDPDLFDRAEAQTIRELGKLARTTSPEAWDRYWARVAELVRAAQ